ncbi:Endo-1,4-beta-xylanase A precursor [Alkalibacterium sp. AK22]|uniref:endo-1,4-beta-xylanase n=1 Tax=Alkalibacterium sp. AK22 TaxID=1229520 RepID=UPI000451EAD3|nr:endo-1,4-beta-xylanase [Alkalibacterium sp. AK22]EXJ23430.1 Endo-1,4-beta-xylanase A precursor [Alkalibacterium sp. AK22]
MNKGTQFKRINGLLSTLILAPIVASSSITLAQGPTELSSETTERVIYHNDFTEDLTTSDGVLIPSGDAELEWFDGIEIEGKSESGVWVRNRTNDYDGIDILFDQLSIEEDQNYSIYVAGYIETEEDILEGATINIETVDGYTWLSNPDAVHGAFELEAAYTADLSDDRAFRIKTNSAGAEIQFAITDVMVTTELQADIPEESNAEVFTMIDFENQEASGFEGRSGSEDLNITNEANYTEGGEYSLRVSNRSDNWHGPELEVTPYVVSGDTYEISAWVKVDEQASQTITLSTQVGETSPTYGNISSVTLNADDGWVEIRGEHRYTSLADGFVSIYVESSNADLAFYIDDVNFEAVESDPIDVQLDLTPIKDIYADHFTIGNIVSSTDVESPRVDLLTHHHDLVTAENAMKPESVYDDRAFNFSGINALINRVHEENLDLHGHVLVWHSQSPDWHHTENGDSLPREAALENMRTHIRTVMENFGEIRSWDVVNEALAGGWENPQEWRNNLRNTGWLRAIGDDYIYEAFLYARQVADENGWHDMVLYYNDYNDHVQGKARTMYYMVKEINEQYATEYPDDERKLISGLGMQGHYNININPENVKQSIERFEQLDIEIGITELDVTLNEGVSAANLEAEMLRQAQIYARLFQIFREHSHAIDRVTFWGLDDASSWRSERYPLIFDGDLRAKPAYYAVIDPDGFLENHPLQESAANQAYAVYGTPEINADIDSVWEQAPVLNMNRMQQAHEIAASGTGRVLWDENNLYVLFEVTDGNLDKSANEAHEQDSVEVFINETNTDTTSYIDGVGQYRVNYANEASFNPTRYSEGVESATRLTGSGYIVEMAIPWKNMTPEVRNTIGFDIQINDARNGARHGVAAWNDYTGGGWQDPSVFGQLTLISSTEEQTALLEERIAVLEDTVADNDISLKELRAELLELQSLLDTLREEVGETDERLTQIEERLAQLEERLAEWENADSTDPDELQESSEEEEAVGIEDSNAELEETGDAINTEDMTETTETETEKSEQTVKSGTGRLYRNDQKDKVSEEGTTGSRLSANQEPGESLPETATAVWTVGLIGLTGTITGAALHALRRKGKR